MADDPAQQSAAARASANNARDPLLGTVVLDRFKIVALIARGAMARVYRAEIQGEDRSCAFKILEPARLGVDDPQFRKRFLVEASVASKLSHPNTAAVFGYGGTDDDLGFVAMEYLTGRTLHRAIREDGPFSEDRLVHVARQICRSVREAHAMGLVHRDLRPSNVFLVESDGTHDFVKVLDYGLVRNANEGTGKNLASEKKFLGSPKHMAPEQIQGAQLDARTDIYSLGVLIYEMLTGKVPFDRPTQSRILQAHMGEAPPELRSLNPDVNVSPAMEAIVFRCLQKLPDMRYDSMDQLLSALKFEGSAVADIVEPQPVSAARPPAIAPPQSSPPPTTNSAERIASLLAHSDGVQTSHSAPRPEAGAKATQNLLALILGAALVIGLAAVTSFAIRQNDSQPTAPTTGSSPNASAVAPNSSVVRIESSPAGATVRSPEGRTLCAPTPCSVAVAGDEVSRGRTLVIAKDGFRDETRSVRPTDGTVAVTLAASQP